jgi:hypothetical protein
MYNTTPCPSIRRRWWGRDGSDWGATAVTGEGLASSASLVRGVLPNRQVPTPSGEGNVMADATQREPVRGPEPVAKRATKNSDPAGWWLVSALQGLKRLRSTIWCSSTPLEVLTDLCDGLGCVCVCHISYEVSCKIVYKMCY